MYNIIKKFNECVMYEFHDFEFMDYSKPDEYLKTDAVSLLGKSSISHRLCRFQEILDTLRRERTVVTTGELVRQWLESNGT